MLTVEKIGGTSMNALKEVLENIILYQPDRIYGRVYVVSAFSGVTNLLLENKKTKAPGVYQRLAGGGDYGGALKEVAAHLKSLNRQYAPLGLDVAHADGMIDGEIEIVLRYLDGATTMLAAGYLKEGILLAAREILASIGESHSAFVLASILQNRQINTHLIDLAGLHDSRAMTIKERIQDAFKDIDLEK